MGSLPPSCVAKLEEAEASIQAATTLSDKIFEGVSVTSARHSDEHGHATGHPAGGELAAAAQCAAAQHAAAAQRAGV